MVELFAFFFFLLIVDIHQEGDAISCSGSSPILPLPSHLPPRMAKRKSEQVGNEPAVDGGFQVIPGKKQRKTKMTQVDDKQAQTSALAYLTQWSKEREAWKFQKVKQSWLLKHVFDADQVDRSAFRQLVKYLSGVQGAARDRLLEQCRSIKAEPKPTAEEKTEEEATATEPKDDAGQEITDSKDEADKEAIKSTNGTEKAAAEPVKAPGVSEKALQTWEERRRRAKKIIKALG
ncbi:hypothetical protein BJ684DRAFT_14299 [Piptocephalis cylindrospora]|uniref:WKF domain-containing protein n=1 Tax=Piptocephalis cylindrospora TaxID=1907219 RepID=A0A4P9Y8W1_9FUNG|nr:hypothetical protein BJ684DRAFT_14299 [Piptocephalis cylindrospora]|eukprot:RKP15475.1 hypothetical protein BJ684DRAFT_14299 [Piptocephalis cylindrospora]